MDPDKAFFSARTESYPERGNFVLFSEYDVTDKYYNCPFGQPGLDYPIRVAYGICTALEPAFLTSAWTLPGQYYHLQTTLVQSLNATYLLPGFYYSVPTFLV